MIKEFEKLIKKTTKKEIYAVIKNVKKITSKKKELPVNKIE